MSKFKNIIKVTPSFGVHLSVVGDPSEEFLLCVSDYHLVPTRFLFGRKSHVEHFNEAIETLSKHIKDDGILNKIKYIRVDGQSVFLGSMPTTKEEALLVMDTALGSSKYAKPNYLRKTIFEWSSYSDLSSGVLENYDFNIRMKGDPYYVVSYLYQLCRPNDRALFKFLYEKFFNNSNELIACPARIATELADLHSIFGSRDDGSEQP